MPSLLVTPKMSRATAARVARSVRGGARPGLRQRSPALLRLGLVLGILGLGGWLWWSYREAGRELEAARSELAAKVKRELSERPARSGQLLAAAERLIVEAATASSAESLEPSPKALQVLLARPSLYLRGAPRDLTLAAHVAQQAAETRRDALLGCLLAPPESEEPSALLERVRAVYAGRAFHEPPLERARLLHDLVISDAYLGKEFEARMNAAKFPEELQQLTKVFQEARLEKLRPASRAEILIYALDEPKKPGSIVELDGSSDHVIRLGVVELATGRTLLRTQLHADPTLFPEKSRARYLRGLSDCRAAFELHRLGLAAAREPAAR